MGNQMTEMLKGTLEGIVLAILAGRPAYGYEITSWLRDKGFTEIADGTIYALLIRIEQRGYVDVEKVPSAKEASEHGRQEAGRRQEAVEAVQGAGQGPAGRLPRGGRGPRAVPHVLRF